MALAFPVMRPGEAEGEMAEPSGRRKSRAEWGLLPPVVVWPVAAVWLPFRPGSSRDRLALRVPRLPRCGSRGGETMGVQRYLKVSVRSAYLRAAEHARRAQEWPVMATVAARLFAIGEAGEANVLTAIPALSGEE